MRVLYIGEIVGKAGVFCIKKVLGETRKQHQVDFVIANGEGATGGFGLGKNHSIYLRKLGIDVLTGGECIYYKRDMVEHIEKATYILRPANYPKENPGRGWQVYRQTEPPIAVIVLLGQAGFTRVHLDNPFALLPDIVKGIREHTPLILVDFHAATTAEKHAMFRYADGKVSAVIGSHMKIITADEEVLPGGTAVICDAGRTGSQDSIGGLDPDVEIRKFLTQIPERSQDAWEDIALQGVLVDIGADGKATSIERLQVPCPSAEQ